jgi:hypothetical protein
MNHSPNTLIDNNGKTHKMLTARNSKQSKSKSKSPIIKQNKTVDRLIKQNTKKEMRLAH